MNKEEFDEKLNKVINFINTFEDLTEYGLYEKAYFNEFGLVLEATDEIIEYYEFNYFDEYQLIYDLFNGCISRFFENEFKFDFTKHLLYKKYSKEYINNKSAFPKQKILIIEISYDELNKMMKLFNNIIFI